MNSLHIHQRNISLFWKIAIVLILLFAFIQSAAHAQSSGGAGGSIGLGPQIGFHKSRDADDARLMGGAALRMKLSPSFGVEGSINYRNEEYRNGAVRVRNWPVMITGLLYPVPIVYGAMGAGWYNTSVEYNFPPGSPEASLNSITDTQQRFGWHFGAGAELPAGSSTKLYGDIRYVFLDYDFKQFPGSEGVNSDFYVVTIGFLFGLQ